MQQESAARKKVTRVARLHGKRRGRGGTQRVGVAAEMNMWEMLVSADSPPLHRPQGTHAEQASERSGNVSRRRRKSPKGECG